MSLISSENYTLQILSLFSTNWHLYMANVYLVYVYRLSVHIHYSSLSVA